MGASYKFNDQAKRLMERMIGKWIPAKAHHYCIPRLRQGLYCVLFQYL